MKDIFRELCSMELEPDGLLFHPETVSAEEIKDNAEYNGVRVKFTATLEKAQIAIQVDIGFGDAVYPQPEERDFPPLLPDTPAPYLRMYPVESVVAEKFQAMVSMGGTNSRVKDLYDIYTISNIYSFDGQQLQGAIMATFERRKTTIGGELPEALTPSYYTDDTRMGWWSSFRDRNDLTNAPGNLSEVGERLVGFLQPTWTTTSENRELSRHWEPGGPWK